MKRLINQVLLGLALSTTLQTSPVVAAEPVPAGTAQSQPATYELALAEFRWKVQGLMLQVAVRRAKRKPLLGAAEEPAKTEVEKAWIHNPILWRQTPASKIGSCS